MRTTVTIDDQLLAEAKMAAARDGRSLGSVVDDALRVLLRGRAQSPDQVDWTFPTSGAGGLQPGVDLNDKDALADLLDR
ncbi:type II toxin-antitoxin system VapB family antitoxin [Flexivirga caeni]|uniref:DUF2191 domain-containing protein n=1 Tax=Flexivirga caeni TaxID=2294115 RepID=A0A3M9M9S4_9MICO|nr:type II toxin-antitoxin system VapB family antitoxin [Flexivirga caeni]RNI21613.1 DUF2191 domain-containing protein [Flexivirga caeni]